MTGRRWWMAVAAVVLLTVGARVIHATRHPDRIHGDGVVYDRLANQLLDDGYLGYAPDHHRSWRPPLYAALVAAEYATFGRRPLTAKIADAGLAGLAALLIALIGGRLGMPWAGVLGALLYGLHGFEIRHAGTVYAETLAAALVALFVLSGVARKVRPARSFLRGLLAGLLLHVQPALITIPVLTALAIAVGRAGRRPLLCAGLLVSGMLVALVPWTIRNHAIHDSFVYVSTNGGFNLMKGNNPYATGGPMSKEGRAWIQEQVAAEPPGTSDLERDRRFRAIAVDWMRENPGRAIGLAATRARAWFLPASLIPPTRWPVDHVTILPLAVIGAVVLLRRRVGGLPVVLAILAASIPAVLVVYAGPRYRTPVVPLICLLAGIGAIAILARILRRWLPSRAARGITGPASSPGS